MWHCVINLEESIAYTQNYVSQQNAARVYEFLKKKTKKELGQRFKAAMEKHHPEIELEEKKKLSAWEEMFL